MLDNIVPYIGGEEEKSEKEPLKILGHIDGNGIVNDDSIQISATCIRVPVTDGHTASVLSILNLRVKFRAKKRSLKFGKNSDRSLKNLICPLLQCSQLYI